MATPVKLNIWKFLPVLAGCSLPTSALASSDGDQLDSECEEASYVIADLPNEGNFSDFDNNFEKEEVKISINADTRDSDGSNENGQTILRNNGSCWRRSNPSQITTGKLQQQNILTIRTESTLFSASRIVRQSCKSGRVRAEV